MPRQQQLVDAIASGNALLLCGAGISIAATGGSAPSWRRLIETAIDFASTTPADPSVWSKEIAQDCRNIVNQSKSIQPVLDVLNLVQDALGGVEGDPYRKWLGTTIGALTVNSPSILETLDELSRTGSIVATTNYDTLISQYMPGGQAVSSLFPQLVDELLSKRRRGVWHLHGCYNDPASVIFSANDYRRIKTNEMTQFLQRMASKKLTLVFVGCSNTGLADDNIGRLLSWFGEHWRATGTQHFVLCKEADVALSWPVEVMPVSFGAHHGALENFLKSLVPKLSGTPQLYPPPPRMIGRANLKTQLAAEIARGTTPIIISGGPGMGKTTLAVAASYEAAAARKYGNRKYFVPLDASQDASSMLGAIASSIGIAVSASHVAAIAAIQAKLSDNSLVLLDNFETPWENDPVATEEVVQYLASSGSSILVTVRGRTPPIGYCLPQIDRLEDIHEAKQIFLQYAGVRSHLHEENPEIETLVSALDGHPLSLRLMGTVAQGYNDLDALKRRWEKDKADLLKDGKSDTRLTSTRASLRSSLRSPALTTDARRLLGVLAILPLGLSRDDADRIMGGIGDDSTANLIAQQLANEVGGRVFMLAPLREAAAIEAPMSGDDASSFLTFYISVAHDAGKIGRSDWPKVRERVLNSAGNLDAVCQFALKINYEKGVYEALRSIARLHRFSSIGSLRSLSDAAVRYEQSGKPNLAAGCHMSLAAVAVRRQDHVDAEQRFSAALSAYQAIGNRAGEANCLQGMAKMQADRGALAEAKDTFLKAESYYDEVLHKAQEDTHAFENSTDGARLGKANCLRGVGAIMLASGAIAEAGEWFGKARKIYDEIKDPLGDAICTQGQADIARLSGDLASADRLYRQALQAMILLGDDLREAECLQGLGDIFEAQLDMPHARINWLAALKKFKAVGYQVHVGHLQLRLARAAAEVQTRCEHLNSARLAWAAVHRDDLIDRFLDGTLDGAAKSMNSTV